MRLITWRALTVAILSFGLSLPAFAEKLTLFQTGNTGGLASAYRYDIELPYVLASRFLQEQGRDAGIEDFHVSGNAIPFYAQQNYLWGPHFGIRQLREFLAQPPAIVSRQKLVLLQSNDSLIADPGIDQQLMSRLEDWLRRTPGLREHFKIREAELIRYANSVSRLRLKEGDENLAADPLEWEILIGFQLAFHPRSPQPAPSAGPKPADQPPSLMVIGQPQGEGSRRMELLQQLRGPQDLLVDSGNLLEGLSSIATNRLSLQRENSLKMIQTLGYFALNVGKNELLAGLSGLQQEQHTYQLPLISASLKQKGNYLFEPFKIVHAGQLRLALIGLGDQVEFENLRSTGLLPPDTEILAPQDALNQALQVLRSQEDVELVGILSNLPGTDLQKLAADQHDVQLILANPDTPLQHIRESLALDGHKQSQSLIVSGNPLAISMVELESDGEDLAMSAEQLPVNFNITPDRQFLPAIMQIRQQAYEDALDPLLPDLGPLIRRDPKLLELFLQSASTRDAIKRLSSLTADGSPGKKPSTEQLVRLFPPYLTAELLANLEMNGLLEAFDTEVMALRIDDSMELRVPGALPRLWLYERLRSSDTLERYYLNGDQLKKLLDLKLPGLVFGGASPEKKQVWGRDIGDKRSVYRLLIPSGLAGQNPVRSLLTGLRRESLLTNPFRPEAGPDRVYLRDAVLSLIKRIQQGPNAETELARLLKPNWQERRLLFSLQLDNLQFNLSGYNAYNNKAYSAVRETRVTSPNSFTFGGRNRLALGLDNQFLGLTTAATARYEGLSVLDETSTSKDAYTENQDDLQFSAELQLRLLEFSLFGSKLTLTPYLESIYDTEFTPTINKTTKALNPLQSELRSVVGLSIPAAGPLKAFKTGLALRRDFNVPDNFEWGLDSKLLVDVPINSVLSWSNDFSLRYFFPSAKDNASSLGLIAQLVSAFNVSLTDNLSLKLYADGYLFQGKQESNSQPGASLILGVGLGYDRIWKPLFEPVF